MLPFSAVNTAKMWINIRPFFSRDSIPFLWQGCPNYDLKLHKNTMLKSSVNMQLSGGQDIFLYQWLRVSQFLIAIRYSDLFGIKFRIPTRNIAITFHC